MASAASVVGAVSQAEAVLLAVWLDTEKELISRLSQALVGKLVIDRSNPIGPDGDGGFTTTLPTRHAPSSSAGPAGISSAKPLTTTRGEGSTGHSGRWSQHPTPPAHSAHPSSHQPPRQSRRRATGGPLLARPRGLFHVSTRSLDITGAAGLGTATAIAPGRVPGQIRWAIRPIAGSTK